MRTIVIGDVHGCYEELCELLKKLDWTEADRTVFLGDLMDRGPRPAFCVRFVRVWLRAECVLSNHDEKHVRYAAHEAVRLRSGKKNPIRFSPEQVAEHKLLDSDDLAWIASRPLSIDLGQGWHAIHAGLEPCKSFAEQRDSQALLRTRFVNEDGTAYTAKDPGAPDPKDKWFWSQRWRGPEKIVYGHHIHRFLGPRLDGGGPGTCVSIDNGCYAGGRLTAMVLNDDGSYWFEHADARRIYVPLSDKYGADRPSPVARAVEGTIDAFANLIPS